MTWLPAAPKPDSRRAVTGRRYTGAGDARYHYQLLVPTGWGTTANRTCTPLEVPVIAFAPSGDATTEIGISVTHLAREVSPADWVELLVAHNGEEVVEMRSAHGTMGRVSDVATRSTVQGRRCIVRTNAVQDADRLFVLRCRAPENQYAALADAFVWALSSFRLLHPDNRPYAEELQELPGIFPVLFTCRYPRSWQLIDHTRSKKRCHHSLYNLRAGRRFGHIELVVERHHGADRHHAMAAELAQQLSVASHELHEVRPPGGARHAWEASWVTQVEQRPAEAAVRIIQYDHCMMALGLLSPAGAEAGVCRATNRRCFELLGETFEVI